MVDRASAGGSGGSATPQAGFTLIELLVVIAIITMLAGLLIGGVLVAKNRANISSVKTFIDAIVIAVKNYEGTFGDYPPGAGGPDSAESLYESLTTDKKGHVPFEFKNSQLVDSDGDGQLEVCDHWRQPLHYLHYSEYEGNPRANSFRVISVGPNGEYEEGDPGTDDITNWQ